RFERMIAVCQLLKRNIRNSQAVVESLDRVLIAVETDVQAAVFHPVAIRSIAEDVAGVVEDDIKDDVNAVGMGGSDHLPQICQITEVRVHGKEILDAVTMVAV